MNPGYVSLEPDFPLLAVFFYIHIYIEKNFTELA